MKRDRRPRRWRSALVDFAVRLLAVLIVVGLIALPISIQIFVPCGYLDWMPITSIPTRCLPQR